MHVSYIGNFSASHSTESHVARAFESAGHVVTRIQEGIRCSKVPRLAEGSDLLLWTQTLDLAQRGGNVHERAAMVEALRAQGTPTVSYHLDRWWGLARQPRVMVEPFFRTDLVITADGGHDEEWARLRINHRWLPPAVSAPECEPGTPQAEYRSDIAFVGSWQGGYHPEWKHRSDLVAFLRREFGDRVKFWPRPGEHAVRNEPLRNLYASVKVVVGDSCLAPAANGRPMTQYISDRVPETIGRGGFLIHPHVDGVTDGSLYTNGTHLRTWPLGDWSALRSLIRESLDDPDGRARITEAGRAHVIANHTYEVRVQQIIDILIEHSLLSPELRSPGQDEVLLQSPLSTLVENG